MLAEARGAAWQAEEILALQSRMRRGGTPLWIGAERGSAVVATIADGMPRNREGQNALGPAKSAGGEQQSQSKWWEVR